MVVGIASGIGFANLLKLLVFSLASGYKITFFSGITVFGATVVLSTLQDIIKNLPDFYTYVFAKDGDSGILPFIKSFGSVFLASFGLMISFYGYNQVEIAKEINQPRVLNMKLEFQQNNVLPLLDHKKPLLVAYVLFDKNANKNSLNNSEKDYSVHPDPNIYDEQIKNLVEALISCGDEKDNPVVIQIRGFASSNKWKSSEDEQPELSKIMEKTSIDNPGDAFNFWIANKRAENVKSLVEKQIGDRKNIKIIDFKWETFKNMNDEMLFEDLDSGNYLETRGFITRRVEIRILKAPACVKRKYK